MLVILEGLDKTGKSTVAEHFRQKQRYEYVHLSAPAKWHTRDSYFAEMLHLLASTAGKNVVIDRSWCGELVWPEIFARDSKLGLADCSALNTVARQIHSSIKLLYMHDPDSYAHMNRILKFKEPVYDFALARELYGKMALNLNFDFLTFDEAEAKGWT